MPRERLQRGRRTLPHVRRLSGELFMVGDVLMIRDESTRGLLSVASVLRSQFIGRHVAIVVTISPKGAT